MGTEPKRRLNVREQKSSNQWDLAADQVAGGIKDKFRLQNKNGAITETGRVEQNKLLCPKSALWRQVNSRRACQGEEPVSGKRWKALFVNILDFLLIKFGVSFLHCELTTDANTWKLFLPFFSPRRQSEYIIQAILFQTNVLNILTC